MTDTTRVPEWTPDGHLDARSGQPCERQRTQNPAAGNRAPYAAPAGRAHRTAPAAGDFGSASDLSAQPTAPRPGRFPVGPNPSGRCLCGCGEATPLAPVTSRKREWAKGQPVKYLKGHSARVTNRTRILESKIPITPTDCGHTTLCLIWGGAVNSKGYPIRGDGNGRNVLVHRESYERVHGPLPPGWHAHHECQQPRCVNADHLAGISHGDHNRLHARLRRLKAELQGAA